VAIVPFQSFAGSFLIGIVEGHLEVLCILLNLPLLLAAVGCTLQWTSETEINKQFQLLFVENIITKITSQW